jgi:wyosine [tRNA(Phe)-imidazoG37] synthetase (radical SAM superfamily)
MSEDNVISQEWIDKVNSDKTPTRACRHRCFYCVLWNIETCIPKDDYKNKPYTYK